MVPRHPCSQILLRPPQVPKDTVESGGSQPFTENRTRTFNAPLDTYRADNETKIKKELSCFPECSLFLPPVLLFT